MKNDLQFILDTINAVRSNNNLLKGYDHTKLSLDMAVTKLEAMIKETQSTKTAQVESNSSTGKASIY